MKSFRTLALQGGEHVRCPRCGAIGMDDCENATCDWDQWNDGTRVTAKQRSDGDAFADAINRHLAARYQKEADEWKRIFQQAAGT
jgi:hypothetical protein